jgi:hypothetical protein
VRSSSTPNAAPAADPAAERILTRRRILTGGAITAGTAVLSACAMGEPDPSDAVGAGVIPVARVARVPVTDPGAEAWLHSYEVTVEMDAQLIALPNRAEPFRPEIRVRAIHDGTRIGFRIRWEDDQVTDNTVFCDGFRDACAVLLAPGTGDEGLRVMGNADTAATLLHWKADWQYDLYEGVRSLQGTFPNVSVDTYPPLGPNDGEITPADYLEADAAQWLPGMAVGNALSQPTRTTCVEKVTANGFGTVTHAPTQNASGFGEHKDGSWRVVLTKPLEAVDEEETGLQPGLTYTCAFALWSGADGDAGGRKTPSKTAYRLELAG